MAEHSVSEPPRGASRPPLTSGRLIFLVTLGVVAVLAGFLVLGALVGEGFGYFGKEPAETFRVPRYIGWAAYAVVLITAAGATTALFAGFVVRHHRGPGASSGFLLGAGWFTVLLVLDDFLRFHDYVYARLFGIQEIVVYPAYALLAAAVAWRWGRHVARTDLSLVLLAGAWLALSVGTDQLVDKAWPYFHVVEDGAKMMGLTLWTAYLMRTAMRLVIAELVPVAKTAPQPQSQPQQPQSTRWQPRAHDVQETVMCHAVTPAVVIPQIPAPRSSTSPKVPSSGRSLRVAAPAPLRRAESSPGMPLSPALRRRAGVATRSRG